MTVSAAEITDTRTEVIAHAREVLERARSEVGTWNGDQANANRVITAMALLEDWLGVWAITDRADQESVDKAVSDVGWETLRLVQAVEREFGDEAAAFVAGDSSDEEGEWVA